MMMMITRHIRTVAVLGLLMVGACASGSGGSLGGILGSILTPTAQTAQLSGTVRGVDTRAQQISIQQSDGSTLGVLYDNQTKVVYQSQLYQVTSLEAGDRVNARVQQRSDNSYYTDSVFVTQPVNNTGGSTSENIQTLQGTVRQIDRTNGWFTLETGPNVVLTVSLPYRPSTSDANRFQNLRIGDPVRITGVYLNNTRVELRQFY
jgi:hypothetical protein